MLSKKDLENLLELSRITLDEAREKKMIGDLEKVLAYFSELNEVETGGVEPLTGGSINENIFRDDNATSIRLPREKAVNEFPETDGGFLKVPPVFE